MKYIYRGIIVFIIAVFGFLIFGDDFGSYDVIHEYRKVNIPTDIPTPGSYNVYIKFHDDYNTDPVNITKSTNPNKFRLMRERKMLPKMHE